jgi:hypothetical protein
MLLSMPVIGVSNAAVPFHGDLIFVQHKKLRQRVTVRVFPRNTSTVRAQCIGDVKLDMSGVLPMLALDVVVGVVSALLSLDVGH